MASKGLTKAQKAARQAKSAALNKQYRADAARLKALGVLSSKVNARANITRATRTKINKYRDVLEGRVLPVRAAPDIRKKYEGVLDARGPFLLVDKEREKDKVKISRGMVEITRPVERPARPGDKAFDPEKGPSRVRTGEERVVVLPFKLVDLPQLVERLQTDESLDGLKRGDEYFAFKIDGWASKESFPDAKEMGDYISNKYAHLFKPGIRRQVVKYLTFVRFKSSRESHGENPRAKEGTHTKAFADHRPGKKPENKFDAERRRKKAAERQRQVRAKETDEQKATRRAKDALAIAQRRQRKFEGY